MKNANPTVLLLPDAGPLITLAYADALDVLLRPGWSVQIVDMVLHEVTSNKTPTSQAIAAWVKANRLLVVPTKTHQHFLRTPATSATALRKATLGELAMQEAMNDFALLDPPPTGVFLFEDHKIARTSFLLPDNCRKVSTRAFLIFLEQKGWLESAAAIERKAISADATFPSCVFHRHSRAYLTAASTATGCSFCSTLLGRAPCTKSEVHSRLTVE